MNSEMKDIFKGTLEVSQRQVTQAMRSAVLELFGHGPAIQAIIIDLLSRRDGGGLDDIHLSASEAEEAVGYLEKARDVFSRDPESPDEAFGGDNGYLIDVIVPTESIDGTRGYFPYQTRITRAEYDRGEHYKRAIKIAENSDRKTFGIAYDEFDNLKSPFEYFD